MVSFFHTQADLDAAMTKLVAAEPRFKPMLEATGFPALRQREAGFAGLAAIIVGQQLSTQSAAAIWGRLAAAFDPFHHDALRKSRAERLGRLGLSAAKIRTLKGIAHDIAKGKLDLEALASREADEAHALLTAIHGIGPWTADLYLLFCLGHADAWPAGDLALQEALRIGLSLPTRPTAKEMAVLGESWRPWRGAAAPLLWAYYRVIKAPGFSALPASVPNPGNAESAVKPGSKSIPRPRLARGRR
jgi:DNA-3-methyladenine glycosylase II